MRVRARECTGCSVSSTSLYITGIILDKEYTRRIFVSVIPARPPTVERYNEAKGNFCINTHRNLCSTFAGGRTSFPSFRHEFSITVFALERGIFFPPRFLPHKNFLPRSIDMQIEQSCDLRYESAVRPSRRRKENQCFRNNYVLSFNEKGVIWFLFFSLIISSSPGLSSLAPLAF